MTVWRFRVCPTIIFSGDAFGFVITGACVSTTFTVLVIFELFPWESVTLYIIVYIPSKFVFTLPLWVIFPVTSPSS